MILSRLVVNPRSYEVRRDLADVQQLHRTVMSLFPQVDAEGARQALGVLFRVDSDARSNPVLLIQSQVQPDWNKLPADYLDTNADPNPQGKDLSAVWQTLAPAMALRFRLRANPTRKIQTKTGPDGLRNNGKRVELRTEQDQIEWLRRKATTAGFVLTSVRAARDVPNLRVIDQGKYSGARKDPYYEGPRSRLTFAAAMFEGILTIADADKFRRALEQGIGSAKAYGFGLLSIAPPYPRP